MASFLNNFYQMAPVNLGQFNQVRLLTLTNVTAYNWPVNLPNKLKYLIVNVRSKDREHILKQAISLNNIETLEFNSSFLHFHDCTDILPKPSTIKHLIFNSQRCFIDYRFLLNNMPYLQSLKAINTYYPHRSHSNLGQFNHLHTIDLTCKHLDMQEMIVFLTDTASNSLHRCRLINVNSSISSCVVDVLIY